jgi:hypothetical protein
LPEEFSRTTARKKVLLPSGDFVYIPVITKISFIDPSERHQEWQYSINNSTRAARVVRVDQVPASSGGEASGDEIAVERIEKWSHIDAYDRGQETQVQLDNNTGKEEIPPHFSTHLKTHVVRYESDDDENIWVDSELIDSFSVIDPRNRYQETIFTLNNPKTDDEAQADSGDPDITNGDGSGEGVEGNPVRTDPFQNIVNFAGTAPQFSFHVDALSDLAGIDRYDPDPHMFDTGVLLSDPRPFPAAPGPIGWAYVQGWTVHVESQGVARPPDTSGPITGPGPTVTLSEPTQTFGAWHYAYRNPSGIANQVALWQPPAAGIGGGVVVGSPLLDGDGQPIEDVIDTLQAHYVNIATPFTGGVDTFSTVGSPNNGNWWSIEGAPLPAGSLPTEIVTTQIVTVSSDPFEFNGHMYQAKGLYPIMSSVGFSTVFIYCVRV